MIKISNILIFGEEQTEDSSDIEELHNLSHVFMSQYIAIKNNPIFLLMPQLSQKLKIVKEINKVNKIF